MKTALGGTFNILHKGHKTLLDTAFSLGGGVVIGITSDDFVIGQKPHHVPLEQRRKKLEEYLHSRFEGWEIEVLEEPMGPTAWDEEIEKLVVSPGTYATGERINEFRTEKGLPPLKLIRVDYVLAEDFLPISSTRIFSGEIDAEGRLQRPLMVAVGSSDPDECKAVERVMELYLRDFEVLPIDIGPSLNGEPWGDSVYRGALEKALAALEQGDLGVGIEAGVIERGDNLYGSLICVIADRGGWMTEGHGSSFMYPAKITELVRSGISVEEAFEKAFNMSDLRGEGGPIGFLTKGGLTQEQLMEQAVTAAMVPRAMVDLYTTV
jgi:inosine/xanthosine triphosphatase